MITPLITAPYLSRVFGADGIGSYSYASSIVSYFTIVASLGTASFGKREISYAQDNIYRRSKVFWETELVSIVSVAICSLIYLGYIYYTEKNIIYYILIFNLLSVAADITWLFQGLEEFKKFLLRSFFIKIVSICYIFLFVKNKSDLPVYVFGIAFFAFFGNVILWLYLPQYICKIKMSDLDPRKSIKEIVQLFIPTIAVQIYTVLDKTMIGLLTNNSFENGYYEQAEKMSKIALSILQSVSTVVAPRICSLYSNDKKDEIEKYMYKSYNFIWLLGTAISFGLMGISANIVPWFYGDGYDPVINLLSILGFLAIPIGINNVTSFQYLIPTKRQNIFTKTVFIGAITNFCLNAILIPKWYSVGAAIGSVAAESVIAITQLIYIRKEISIINVFKLSVKYVVASFVMLGVVYIENLVFDPSIIHTVIMIATGAIVYFFILIFVFRDKFTIELVRPYIQKIYKVNRSE